LGFQKATVFGFRPKKINGYKIKINGYKIWNPEQKTARFQPNILRF
jgi:hypothetical protein